jgi:hypothetical protein
MARWNGFASRQRESAARAGNAVAVAAAILLHLFLPLLAFSAATALAGTVTYQYDDAGRLKSATYPNEYLVLREVWAGSAIH